MKFLNSILSGQKISFEKQMNVSFKKTNIQDVILNLLDNDEVMKQTFTLEPKVHSINSFFTFFLNHDHCIDNTRNLGFSDLLWSDEDARLLYAGSISESMRSFCGMQSKEFYSLSEFITNNNLWPDHSDIRIKNSRRLKWRLLKPFIKCLRTGVKFLSRGKLCSVPYDQLINVECRGYRVLMRELARHQRNDLIALCEKYHADKTFPIIFRSVAECRPEKIMRITADESIILAMEKFYSNTYRKNILERVRKNYLPRTIEFANIMVGLLVKK